MHATKVIAENTDIALLLMYHWNDSLHDIIMTSERSNKSWCIRNSCSDMSPDVKSVLPFIHAFSGCDTTSAIYGHGKPKLYKLIKGEFKYSIIMYIQLFTRTLIFN